MSNRATPSPVAQLIIQRRALAREKRAQTQLEAFDNRQLHKLTIESKLRGLLQTKQFENLCRCGNETITRICKECGTRKEYTYRCSLKWCPECNWRVALHRREKLAAWSSMIAQPKHVVLTIRNFPILTRTRIRRFTLALAKLRRTKVFQGVRGGSASIEITNEGNGWHLHAHCLVDADWIDAGQLAITWGRLVEQEYGIVKVKDVRRSEYLCEVTKYVVKSSDMARWAGEHINEFVRAIRGLRFFFTFGTLTTRSKEVAAIINSQRPPPTTCECGCGQFVFKSELDEILDDLRRRARK